ncbi:type I-C CRISPR-associated protein Cas8c/Csd1 [Azospirillum agricola]|uniref:type I-C CRISPR-associated protein Cas8c/Csd1 n=1 Tax=Azospirillum agricola TaxID=1720247 RepID=UPI000A0EF2E0|nr:type I-C CRISPR-associated protein Cas8c/Csd1 [Azospirillum agricola]SMH57375.1 CRISPR-associated protein, Csd1 family [Azospirillum lipoferum]
MIVTELHRLYERLRDVGDLPPYGYSYEKVTGCVVLHPDGRVFAVQDQRSDEPAGKKGKTVKRPSLQPVPQPPRRAYGISPGFLCDNASYFFGYNESAKPERIAQQFAAARARHEAVLAEVAHPWAQAVLAFFRSWTAGAAPDVDDLEILSGWLVFRVINENDCVHSAPEIRTAWEHAMAAEAVEAVTGQCLATGEADQPIIPTHPAIKNVPGAQPSGAALVSFNAPAYESYGKSQNFNAPVSARVAHGYTAALNHLLARRGERHLVIGEVSVVFWTDRPTRFESEFGFVVTRPDIPAEDETRAREVRDALERLAKGRDALEPGEAGARFFVLGLSPNAARLAVRFWSCDSLGVVADRVAWHLRDTELVRQWDTQPKHPSLWALAMETRTKYRGDGDAAKPDPNDKGLNKLHGDLLRAVFGGGPYPASLLAVLLDRIRADHVVNHPRVALIKAVLVRRARLAGTIQQEENTLVGLDESRLEPGYLLGRQFAVLERIQQEAADGRELNATIRDKYIGSASSTPKLIFHFLNKLAQQHLKKLRRDAPGSFRFLENRLESIAQSLHDYDDSLSVDDRGLFFIGYYHERHWLWLPKAERDALKAARPGDLNTDPE